MTAEQIELLIKLALAIFAAGGIWNELKAIRRDIKRLEEKQDKYNTLQERMVKQEVLSKTHQNDITEIKQVIYGNTPVVH